MNLRIFRILFFEFTIFLKSINFRRRIYDIFHIVLLLLKIIHGGRVFSDGHMLENSLAPNLIKGFYSKTMALNDFNATVN